MSKLPLLKISAGPFVFEGRLETELAPQTCAAMVRLLPYRQKLVHVRWSGEGVWVPLGDMHFDLKYENHTSYPAPGQMILYPGGISECEILLANGSVHFSSKLGQLAGTHFITLTSNLDQLQALGKTVLWSGAQDLLIEMV